MALVLVALAVGVLLQWSIGSGLGVGVTLLVIFLGAGLLALSRPTRRARIFVIATMLIAPWFVLRASPVLLGFDLVAVTVLLSLGAAYARGADPFAATVRGYAVRAVCPVAAVGRGAVGLVMPFLTIRGQRARLTVIVRSAIVVVPVVSVLVVLLGSADPVFARIVRTPITSAPSSLVPRAVVAALGALGFAALVARARRAPDVATADDPLPTPEHPGPESAALLGAALAVLATFLIIQAAVLFGDRTWFFEQEGLTAATYALEGFWQMLAAAGFTGLVVALAWHLGGRGGTRSFRPLTLILFTLITLLLMSATSRLALYEWAFGFTWLRILGHAMTAFVAVVLAGAAVCVVAKKPGWLPFTATAAAVVILMVLNYANPERFIAERNLARAAQGHALDVGELTGLTADAWPAIVASLPDLDRCEQIATQLLRSLDDVDGATTGASWNIARSSGAEAVRTLRETPVPILCAR